MTAEELRATWGARDDRYALSRDTPSESMIAGVRAWRQRELDLLNPRDRGLLARDVLSWMPPAKARR